MRWLRRHLARVTGAALFVQLSLWFVAPSLVCAAVCASMDDECCEGEHAGQCPLHHHHADPGLTQATVPHHSYTCCDESASILTLFANTPAAVMTASTESSLAARTSPASALWSAPVLTRPSSPELRPPRV
jgi:hypothetical protein